jgi:hypothetical protein
MTREAKTNELVELAKGLTKGTIGVIARATIAGQPAADGLYESIESDTGKGAYWLMHGIAAGAVAAGTIAYYID